MRTHAVDKLLEQHCYKSAAGLLQLARFYVCMLMSYQVAVPTPEPKSNTVSGLKSFSLLAIYGIQTMLHEGIVPAPCNAISGTQRCYLKRNRREILPPPQ
jgi:uncharacterized membrane protein YcfT